MNHELKYIRAFLTLAEELHFSRAAARQNLTQPAFSRRIRDLEKALGTPLVKRTTRHVALTDAGQAFLSQARQGIGYIERAVTLARQAAEGAVGELRVGYMSFAINGRLPAIVRSFRNENPDIHLDLVYMSTAEQRMALMEHKIDIGFLVGTVDNTHIRCTPFDHDTYVALLPKNHHLARKRKLTLYDLATQPFVFGDAAHWGALREPVFTMCHQLGFFPEIVQEASNSEGIFGLVAAGTGVSIYGGCARNIRRHGIVIRNLADVQQRVPMYAAWDSRSDSTVLVRFLDFLEGCDSTGASH